jgi:hypothetical protein
MGLRSVVLACALLGAVGCGKTRAEKILDEQRAECASYVGMTIVQAERIQTDNAWLNPPCRPGEDAPVDPAVERFQRFAGDGCDHTQLALCDLGWCYFSSDSSACGDFGCFYGCGIRVVPKDDNGDGLIDDDTVICGSRFTSGQPAPPYCPGLTARAAPAAAQEEP